MELGWVWMRKDIHLLVMPRDEREDGSSFTEEGRGRL